MLVGGGRAIFKHKKLSILINVMIIQTYLDMYLYTHLYVCSYSSYFMLPVLYFMMILCTSINKCITSTTFSSCFIFCLKTHLSTVVMLLKDTKNKYKNNNKNNNNTSKPKEKKKDPFLLHKKHKVVGWT